MLIGFTEVEQKHVCWLKTTEHQIIVNIAEELEFEGEKLQK